MTTMPELLEELIKELPYLTDAITAAILDVGPAVDVDLDIHTLPVFERFVEYTELARAMDKALNRPCIPGGLAGEFAAYEQILNPTAKLGINPASLLAMIKITTEGYFKTL